MPAPMLPDTQLKATFDVAKYKDPFLLNENGTLKTNMKFSADMVGFLSTTVRVSDAAGSSTAQVKVSVDVFSSLDVLFVFSQGIRRCVLFT